MANSVADRVSFEGLKTAEKATTPGRQRFASQLLKTESLYAMAIKKERPTDKSIVTPSIFAVSSDAIPLTNTELCVEIITTIIIWRPGKTTEGVAKLHVV